MEPKTQVPIQAQAPATTTIEAILCAAEGWSYDSYASPWIKIVLHPDGTGEVCAWQHLPVPKRCAVAPY